MVDGSDFVSFGNNQIMMLSSICQDASISRQLGFVCVTTYLLRKRLQFILDKLANNFIDHDVEWIHKVVDTSRKDLVLPLADESFKSILDNHVRYPENLRCKNTHLAQLKTALTAYTKRTIVSLLQLVP